jgi:hypothetical protein
MRHWLLLVARFYTEPRLIEIRGRMGWESIQDFRGSHLLGQTNVRVFPGSLEYLNRQQVTARVQYYAQMGWISPQQAMPRSRAATSRRSPRLPPGRRAGQPDHPAHP